MMACSPVILSTLWNAAFKNINDPCLAHAPSMPIRGLHLLCENAVSPLSRTRQIRTCDRQGLSLHPVWHGDSDWRTVRTPSWDPKSIRADLTLVQAQVSIQS